MVTEHICLNGFLLDYRKKLFLARENSPSDLDFEEYKA
jgi:hypothetical protein